MKITLSAFADEASDFLDKQLDALHNEGMPSIEIRNVNGFNISQLRPIQARQLRRKLDHAGIRVSALGSPYGKIKLSDDFSPHLEKFKQTLEIASILDAPYIRLFSFYLNGQTHADAREQVFDQLGQIVEAAKDTGIRCCHENEKGIYGDTADHCAELFTEFRDALGCVFDPANFLQCGVDAWDAYQQLAPFITYYHIKDVRLSDGCIVPAGQGDGEIVRLMKTLKTLPGEAVLSLEPHLQYFTGLASLEQDRGERIKHQYHYKNNRESFSAAAAAMKNCLIESKFNENDGIWQ